jgi:hypothetical protein
MRRLATMAGALALLLPATGSAFDHSYPSADQNLQQAGRDAASAFAMLQLPADARRSEAEPDGDSGVLAQPAFQVGTPNFVDRAEWWIVPGDMESVIEFVRAHPPFGLDKPAVSGGSGVGSTGPKYASLGYLQPRIWNILGWRMLAVTATPLADGLTGVRVDGEAVWLVPRPESERVPSEARFATVGVHGKRAVRLAAHATVSKLAQLVDDLELTQPGLRLCPRASPSHHSIRLAFRTKPDGPPLAVAIADYSGGCAVLHLSIAGQPQPTLDLLSRSGARLTRELRRILEIRH